MYTTKLKLDATGHVDLSQIVLHLHEHLIGIGFSVAISDNNIVQTEQTAEAIVVPQLTGKLAELNRYSADLIAFMAVGERANAAIAAGQIVIEGAKVDAPDAAAAVLTCITIGQALAAKNLPAVEAQLPALFTEIIKAAPELGIKLPGILEAIPNL